MPVFSAYGPETEWYGKRRWNFRKNLIGAGRRCISLCLLFSHIKALRSEGSVVFILAWI